MTAHIGTLERRLQYLEIQIEDAEDNEGNPNPYNISEAKALRAALLCMRFVGISQTVGIVSALRKLAKVAIDGDDDEILNAADEAILALRLLDEMQ